MGASPFFSPCQEVRHFCSVQAFLFFSLKIGKFREEIEAPMWMDFTLEDHLMYNDIDDDWFQTVHPFHQFPSHHLNPSYSLLSEGELKSSEILRQSPEIPGSVSKSRGNHYRSRKWEEIGQVAVMSKQHPIRVLGGKASPGAISTNLTRKITPKSSVTKPVTSSRNLNGSHPKASFTSECTSTSITTSKSPGTRTKVSLRDSKGTSFSNSGAVSGSNQQSSGLELPTCKVHTTQLLSSISISLSRSSVTRHASRVEVKGEQLKCHKPLRSNSIGESRSNSLPRSSVTRHASRAGTTREQLKHCRPSRSKSSGESSSNLECHRQGTTHAANKGIIESRNNGKALHPTNGKVPYIWKANRQQAADEGSRLNLKQGLRMGVAESIDQEANSKPVLHCTKPRKDLISCKVKNVVSGKVVATSERPKSSQKVSDMARFDKENSLTSVGCSKKSLTGTTHWKDFNGLFNVKMKSEGRTTERNPGNASVRRHFR